jgi:hypothetical protein
LLNENVAFLVADVTGAKINRNIAFLCTLDAAYPDKVHADGYPDEFSGRVDTWRLWIQVLPSDGSSCTLDVHALLRTSCK